MPCIDPAPATPILSTLQSGLDEKTISTKWCQVGVGLFTIKIHDRIRILDT